MKADLHVHTIDRKSGEISIRADYPDTHTSYLATAKMTICEPAPRQECEQIGSKVRSYALYNGRKYTPAGEVVE